MSFKLRLRKEVRPRMAAEKYAPKLAEQLREAIKLLNLCDPAGERMERIEAPEDFEVAKLCNRVGYGAVMDSAARQWRRIDWNGAHTTGPCAGTVRNAVNVFGAVLAEYDEATK